MTRRTRGRRLLLAAVLLAIVGCSGSESKGPPAVAVRKAPAGVAPQSPTPREPATDTARQWRPKTVGDPKKSVALAKEPATPVVLYSPLPAAEVPPPPPKKASRVAVVAPLHADGSDPETARLADTITEILAIALADQRTLAVVERAQLRKVLDEQKLGNSGLVEPATAARIGKILSAEVVVAGTLLESMPKVRGSVAVIAVEGQRVLGSVELTGTAETLVPDMIAAAGQVAKVAGLELPALKDDELDDSPVARVHLMRGVGLYHANNLDEAIASCLRAVQLDPRLQEARLWIARSYLRLGDPAHARAELQLLARNPAAQAFEPEINRLLAECGKKK